MLATPLLLNTASADIPRAAKDDPRYKLGYLVVTYYPGVASNGTGDSLAGLQEAVDDAYANGLVALFPSGTYVISDTLRCRDWHLRKSATALDANPCQSKAFILQGSSIGPRPVIKLADSPAGDFDGIGSARPLLMYRLYQSTNYPNEAQADPAEPNILGAPTGYQVDSSYLFNWELRNLDFDCNGHAGAVGVVFPAAQGSLVAGVRVNATNAFAGFEPALTGAGAWSRIDEYSHTDQRTTSGTRTFTTYSMTDGVVSTTAECVSRATPNSGSPPYDLLLRHLPLRGMPAYEGDGSRPAVVVTDPPYNAVPGDAFDDTAAIQQAIDDASAAGHGRVMIPKFDTFGTSSGAFLLTGTLVLRSNTVLFGAAKGYVSELRTHSTWRPATATDIVQTEDNASGSTYLGNLAITADTSPFRHPFTFFHWRAGRASETFNLRADWPYDHNPPINPNFFTCVRYSGNAGGRHYFSPEGTGRELVKDDYPSGDQNRSLRITGTTQPLWLYGFNLEGGLSDQRRYDAEITGAANIRWLGYKREGECSMLLLSSVTNFALYSAGAMREALPLGEGQFEIAGDSADLLMANVLVQADEGTNPASWTLVEAVTGQPSSAVVYPEGVSLYRRGAIDDAAARLDITGSVDSVGDGIPDWWRARYFGGDGNTTNALSCAAAAKKWFPGHYVMLQPDTCETDNKTFRVLKGADGKLFQGLFMYVTWGQIEAAQGSYRWDRIDTLLKALPAGKRAAFSLSWQGWGGAQACPGDMLDNPAYDGGQRVRGSAHTGSGRKMRSGVHFATIHMPATMDRYLAFTKAFAARYDADPRLAFVTTAEIPYEASLKTGRYDEATARANMFRLVDMVRHFQRTPCGVLGAWWSFGGGDTQKDRFAKVFLDAGGGFGFPDLICAGGSHYQSHFRPNVLANAGRWPCWMGVEFQDLMPDRAGKNFPDDQIASANMTKVNFIWWIATNRRKDGGYDFDTDVLNFLRANPLAGITTNNPFAGK